MKKQRCNTLVRQNTRKLERDISQLRQLDLKTQSLITQSAARGSKANTPAATKAANDQARLYARELVRIRHQSQRLHTSKAQLQSVGMQVNNAFSVRKIQGSLAASTSVMRDVNSLVKLPALTGAMRELSAELMKAGIIEEMVDDTMITDDSIAEDEEADAEIEQVLGQVLKEKLPGAATPMDEPLPTADEVQDDDEQEQVLAQMRGRLEALKS